MTWDDILTRLLNFLLALVLGTASWGHVATASGTPVPDPSPTHRVPSSTPRPTPDPTRKPKVADPGGSWHNDPEVSWYGPGFYGHRTACGLAYTKTILGVAHRSLPCGTLVEFAYGNRTATVPVIDRGPYVTGRIWDLSGGLCTYLRHCFTGPIKWRLVHD